jgi:hypothetical protein
MLRIYIDGGQEGTYIYGGQGGTYIDGGQEGTYSVVSADALRI